MTTVVDATAQLATTTTAQLAILTPDERARLHACEKEIRQGLYAWQIMAAALQEVRDARLYRETHTTFGLYCQEVWNVGASRIRQLCSGLQTAEALPRVTLPTEKTARAAGRLLRAKGPEVTAATLARLEETGPLTVAVIEAEVEQTDEVIDEDPNWIDHTSLLATAIVKAVSDYVAANPAISNKEINLGVVNASIELSDGYPSYCRVCAKGRKHANSICPLTTGVR